jgi:hypothetical protein
VSKTTQNGAIFFIFEPEIFSKILFGQTNIQTSFYGKPRLVVLSDDHLLNRWKKIQKEFQKSMMRHIWRIFLFQVQSGINKQFFRGI